MRGGIPSVPRIRGDDPHAQRVGHVFGGVFPAYAGMIPGALALLEDLLRVPRIRGDDPWPYSERELIRWCSPHTRG